MKQPLELSCVVPYRRWNNRVEFCLIRADRANSWEFPKAVVSGGQCRKVLALREAEAAAGLVGQLDESPLGRFASSRGSHAQSVIAFLMLVTNCHDQSIHISLPTRRWCLAEEARVRIRRKPLRRLIDEAVRRSGQRRGTVSATALSPARTVRRVFEPVGRRGRHNTSAVGWNSQVQSRQLGCPKHMTTPVGRAIRARPAVHRSFAVRCHAVQNIYGPVFPEPRVPSGDDGRRSGGRARGRAHRAGPPGQRRRPNEGRG